MQKPEAIAYITGNLLSPEHKIILYIFFVFSLLLLKNVTIYLFIFVAISIFLVRIPFRSLRSGWIPISLFLLFTFIGNMLFQHGRIICSIGPLLITQEGLDSASVRTLRVFFMIVGAKILTATTEMELLVNAIANILKPLERLGIPVAEFFSTMGLAMRSLPRIKDQMATTYRERVKGEKITGFWNRAKAISIFLMPLLIKSIQSPEVFFNENDNISNVIAGRKRQSNLKSRCQKTRLLRLYNSPTQSLLYESWTIRGGDIWEKVRGIVLFRTWCLEF